LMVEENGEFIGIITSHDISRKAVTKNLDIAIAKVSEVMAFPLIKLDAEKGMADAAEIMREKGIHHLLITQNDQPLGILSINDYIDYLVATL
jgi:CBS domain-containing protein